MNIIDSPSRAQKLLLPICSQHVRNPRINVAMVIIPVQCLCFAERDAHNSKRKVDAPVAYRSI